MKTHVIELLKSLCDIPILCQQYCMSYEVNNENNFLAYFSAIIQAVKVDHDIFYLSISVLEIFLLDEEKDNFFIISNQ